MSIIDSLLNEISEETITDKVARLHDAYRMGYSSGSNTVNTYDDFSERIGDYYQGHFAECIAGGVRLPRTEAEGRAKQIIEQNYRNHGGIEAAYMDCHLGHNGGLRRILDIIADHIKEEAIYHYVRHQFDTHVSPASYEQRVEIMRQFFDRYGAFLSPSIRTDQPQRYAHDYKNLVNNLIAGMQKASAGFRRL